MIEPTKKQYEAIKYITDNVTTEILFGGGAGGGKSALGCLMLISGSTKYPGTRWLMGRSKLKALKETTLNTFFDVCKLIGFENQYTYNANSHKIIWRNGSEIVLRDLFLYPSDKDFDSLGSLEITGAFVDEASQITAKARNVLKSRIRYKLNDFLPNGEPTKDLEVYEYDENGIAVKWYDSNGNISGGLIPKLVMSCNPAKGWTYTDFYKLDRDNEMPAHRKFIQSLVGDNRHVSRHYVENLKQMDKASKERLLYGNWEFDDDPAKLIDYDCILDLFTNVHVEAGRPYMSVDAARMGSDKAVIMVWKGLKVVKLWASDKTKINELFDKVTEFKKEFRISNSKIVIDEDGVGGGLVDMLPNCIGFVNNGRPLKGENYANIKSQCYYKLAELINKNLISICETDYKDLIAEELEYVKSYRIDTDNKMRIFPKEKVKEIIGRSPDFADALMFRMYFEVRGFAGIKSGGVISHGQ